MRVAIVFPGQGTQAAGMGRPWKGHASWSVVDAVERALAEPLAPLLLDASAEQLGRTREAQLAVLTTSLVAWDAARASIEAQHEIVGFAGHSLGQVTALIASGSLSLEEGVRFTRRRAERTQAAADAHPGRMAALVGSSIEQAHGSCEAAPDSVWVANDNAPGQVVIAGTAEGVDAATERAKTLGVRRALPLPVGGAFHTPLMADACAGLDEILATITFHDPRRAVVSNEDAQPYPSADGWHARLVRHPTVTVEWRASMLTLAGQLGAQALIEVGHGTMIAGVAKRTVPGTPVIGIAEPHDVEAPRGAERHSECPRECAAYELRRRDQSIVTDQVSTPNHAGEVISMPERLIVAPSVGRFRLTTVAYCGAFVDEGQEIGVVEGPSTEASVRSPFSGRLMGVLALEGERLRAGQPVAWLRAAS